MQHSHLMRIVGLGALALLLALPALSQKTADQRPCARQRVQPGAVPPLSPPATSAGTSNPRLRPGDDEYDMNSIARSDSFDVHKYELTLDVTDYSYQLLDAHAAIELEVVDAAATDLWFDLVELTVDSIHIDGAVVF